MTAKLAVRITDLVLCTLGAVTAFSILQLLADVFPWRDDKRFLFLSKRAMPIYLFHQQITHLSKYWLGGHVNPYLTAAVNFILALTLSTLIASLLLRFKLTRFLIGEK